MTTRVCRGCGIEKPLTREYFFGNPTKYGYYFRPQCKPCRKRYEIQRIKIDPAVRWEREYAAIERRVAYRDDLTSIPDPDPSLELAVIVACWQDCVEVGKSAEIRMVKKLYRTACALGDVALADAATAYLSGGVPLALVWQTLACQKVAA